MYLHLGSDTAIRYEDVVAVCDMDKATVSRITKEFLARAEKNGETIDISTDLPKSFVVCTSGGRKNQRIYITQISSQTLYKRSERNYDDTL